jgi:hypothetical protein
LLLFPVGIVPALFVTTLTFSAADPGMFRHLSVKGILTKV